MRWLTLLSAVVIGALINIISVHAAFYPYYKFSYEEFRDEINKEAEQEGLAAFPNQQTIPTKERYLDSQPFTMLHQSVKKVLKGFRGKIARKIMFDFENYKDWCSRYPFVCRHIRYRLALSDRTFPHCPYSEEEQKKLYNGEQLALDEWNSLFLPRPCDQLKRDIYELISIHNKKETATQHQIIKIPTAPIQLNPALDVASKAPLLVLPSHRHPPTSFGTHPSQPSIPPNIQSPQASSYLSSHDSLFNNGLQYSPMLHQSGSSSTGLATPSLASTMTTNPLSGLGLQFGPPSLTKINPPMPTMPTTKMTFAANNLGWNLLAEYGQDKINNEDNNNNESRLGRKSSGIDGNGFGGLMIPARSPQPHRQNGPVHRQRQNLYNQNHQHLPYMVSSQQTPYFDYLQSHQGGFSDGANVYSGVFDNFYQSLQEMYYGQNRKVDPYFGVAVQHQHDQQGFPSFPNQQQAHHVPPVQSGFGSPSLSAADLSRYYGWSSQPYLSETSNDYLHRFWADVQNPLEFGGAGKQK